MTAAPDKAILILDEVRKTYRTRGGRFGGGGKEVVALDDVSLEIKAGELFGLVGESGSGKTTAGRLIVGLEKPDSGRITLRDQDIVGMEPKALRKFRRHVQMVFQDPYQSLNPQISVLDSVAEPLITNKIGEPAEREERVLEALKKVGLTPPELFIYRFPHQLSGGQRQRVAIARAMILEPTCVVADEPTSMLDASYSAHIFEILLGVCKDIGATVLFITHSLAAARYLCDRVAVIYHGQLMEVGTADQVIQDPGHPYTQALLDATPKFGRGLDYQRHKTLLDQERETAARPNCAFFPRCKLGEEPICFSERPGWTEVGDGRLVACHFAK